MPVDPIVSRRQLLAGATATAAGLAVLGSRPASAATGSDPSAGTGAATGAAGAASRGAGPALLRAGRPEITHGVQSGDVLGKRAIVWARADRASRLWVHVANTESARAGASTPTGAACAASRRCAPSSPTSSCSPATRSTPTAR